MASTTASSGYRRSSFFWPMQFLGSDKRAALQTLYHWCRVVDDAIDDAPNQASALEALAFWETEIVALYAGAPQHKTNIALQTVIQTYGLEQRYFTDMLTGFRMDAEEKALFPTAEDMHHYCYAVASCVGLLALPIFGNTSDEAHIYAIALGHALQRTNILRDIQKDATNGRIYLPRAWWEEASLPLPDASTVAERNIDQQVRQTLINEAERYFAEAQSALENVTDKRSLLPAIMMQEIYVALLQRVAKHGKATTPLPRLEKATALMKALRKSVI